MKLDDGRTLNKGEQDAFGYGEQYCLTQLSDAASRLPTPMVHILREIAEEAGYTLDFLGAS